MTMSSDMHSVGTLSPSRVPLHTILLVTTESVQCKSQSMPSPSKSFHHKSILQSKHETTNPNGKKCVSFGKAKAVVVVENGKTMSQKEKDRRWLRGDDIAAFKRECRHVVDELKRSGNATIFAYRGLEMVDPEAVIRRRRHQTNANSAVLIEQREQRSKAVSNPKAIRKVYRTHIMESIKEALENAYIDEKAVKDYMSTTNSELEEESLKSRELNSQVRRRSLLRPKAMEVSGASRMSFRRSFSAATLQSLGISTDESSATFQCAV
jgi:hypothetical protein